MKRFTKTDFNELIIRYKAQFKLIEEEASDYDTGAVFSPLMGFNKKRKVQGNTIF